MSISVGANAIQVRNCVSVSVSTSQSIAANASASALVMVSAIEGVSLRERINVSLTVSGSVDECVMGRV